MTTTTTSTNTMFDLPEELVEEILSRVPMTSLRSVRLSCKKWNALSKNRIVGKAATSQFIGFIMRDFRVCALRLDLQGIRNDDGGDLGYPSIKQVSVLNHIEVFQTFHCDGLLLCVLKDYSRLLVWNPYLGQSSWIQPRNDVDQFDHWFALGYDKSRNHKILRMFHYYRCNELFSGSEIYEFSSKSWRVLVFTPHEEIRSLSNRHGQSLNGNAYFCAEEKIIMQEGVAEAGAFLLCFDFTSERFGPRLSLPFHASDEDALNIYCVRDEQLAVLHEPWDIMEIWVTNKTDHGQVSWSKFLEVDKTDLFTGHSLYPCFRSFFIDEEERVAVFFHVVGDVSTGNFWYQTAHIIGQDGYFKPVKIEQVKRYALPLVCSSYVPSLVKID